MRKSPWSRAIALVLAFVMVCTGALAAPQIAEAASKPKEITLSAKKRTLYVGKSFTLKVKSVKPTNASKAVTFKSSNTKVATVTAKGKVTGKKVGKATITVTSTSNKKLKATCKITVKQQVNSISVTNAIRRKVVVPKGKTLTLKTVVKPDNAADKGLTYTVGKPKIVTVNANGKIKATKYGSNRIAIQSKDKQKRLVIVVYVPRTRIKSASLNATKKSLDIGKTYQLKGVFKPANASVKVVSFASSNPKVACVSTFGKVKALSPGKTVITMTTLDGNKKAKCTITVNPVKVTGVTVVPESQELILGQQFTVSAHIAPSNATNKAVTWKSSNTDVVRITQSGLATAVGVGEAEVTATAKDGSGKSGKCKVTVLPEGGKLLIKSIKVIPSEKSLSVGESAVLEAEITLDDNTLVNDGNKDKYPVSWISDRPDVATVEPETGKVTAVAVGTANISAVARDGSGEMGTCKLTVSAGVPTPAPEVILIDEKVNLQVGGTKDLEFKVTPEGTPVTWNSNDESVATVVDGKVTAVKAGTAIITASVKGGNTATCTVNVSSNTPQISLTEVEVNLQVGGTIGLKWVVSPANAAVTWTSDKDEVASVVDGVITAKAQGTAVITASVAGGNSVKCTVNVIPGKTDASEIVLVQEKVNMEVGEEVTLKWSTKPEGAKVNWSSSNTDVAEVANGTIKAKAVGNAIISASLEDGTTVTCEVAVTAPRQEDNEIVLIQSEVNLLIGEETTLKWSVKPAGTPVTWTSDLPEIAKVEDGKITAVSEGTATITATIAGGAKAECTVHVGVPTQPDPDNPQIILTEMEVNLQVDEKTALKYTVNPAGTAVTWSSDKETVATVSSNGEITAVSEGTAIITGSVANGNTVKCTVNVTPKPEDPKPQLILKDASVRMQEGQQLTLNWTVTPEGTEVHWQSSDEEVATVVDGNILALKAGDATITGSVDGGNTVTCEVKVVAGSTDAPVISITQVEVNLQIGAETKLTWSVDPENTPVEWSSEDETVATVEEGVIKAVGAGKTTITAKAQGGNSVQCIVNVVADQPVLSLEEESLNLVVGITRKLTWLVKPEGTKVTWSSSDESVATVDEEGRVTGVSEGTAEIKGSVDGGNEVICMVTVSGVSITLNETQITLKANQQEGFQLTTTLKPEDLEEAVIIWDSTDKLVADVVNGLVVPRKIPDNEWVLPERHTTITATVQIGGKTVAVVTCDVTVIAEESAEIQDDDNFIYVLNGNAEGYRIERGDQTFEVTKEDVTHDLALFAQKLNDITWDNNFLKNYWDRFNTESLRESNILALLLLKGKPEVKDIDATTKEVTMRGRTVTVKRIDGQDSSSLLIIDQNGKRQAYVENIQATEDSANVTITAAVGASATGKRMDIQLVISKDGKNITFNRLVNNKIRPVVTFSQLDDSFELKVNQMYYDEFVDMFGSDLDFLSQMEIYNVYY